MERTCFVNAIMVNEGRAYEGALRVEYGRIAAIGPQVTPRSGDRIVDCGGRYLLPGMIDDQVHFREPGATHKGCIATESAAAVVGGVTSYMEMPNTAPPTLDDAAIDRKKAIAQRDSLANYAFYLGAANNNLEAVKAVDPRSVAGVKVFMGASTGNMLVDDPEILRGIFAHAPCLIATHCEDTPMIQGNLQAAKAQFGDTIPAALHAEIRSREACWASSSLAIGLAKEFGSRLHVLHLTTADEMAHFAAGDHRRKQITAEVCVHHLFFASDSYASLGTHLMCNPSVKHARDRQALRQALASDVIDVIATDHAPHTLLEKARPYTRAPAGLPLVENVVPALLDLVADGVLDLPRMVQKTAHAVADCYQVVERGYLREGYWADIIVVDPQALTIVDERPVRSRCAWTPFVGRRLRGRVDMTMVSGRMVYDHGQLRRHVRGRPLVFDR
ncbi:MAG: dihydroorotase [Planctomycetota bacterium]|nr:MAG: dihydroorotase [Planctomycetota bacterium]